MSPSSGAVSAVTTVEIEASLQRISRGEGDFNDSNLLRSIIQRLEGIVEQYELALASSNQSDEINAYNQSIRIASPVAAPDLAAPFRYK